MRAETRGLNRNIALGLIMKCQSNLLHFEMGGRLYNMICYQTHILMSHFTGGLIWYAYVLHTLASYESAHGIQIQSRGIKKPGAPASERLHASIQDSIQHWNWNGTIIMIIMAERLWIEEGGEIQAAFSLCSNQWLMPGVVRSPVSWPHCFVSSDQRSRGWWRTMHQDAGDNIP